MSGNQASRGRGGGRGRGDNLPYHPRGRGGPSRGGQSFGRGRGGGTQSEVALFSHESGGDALPDRAIRALEDKIEASAKAPPTKTSPSSLIAKLPPRPGFGTQGREVLLWTNYMAVASSASLVLQRYHLEILPDGAGRQPKGKKARRLVELLLEDHLAQYKDKVATDFRSTLISSTKLDLVGDNYDVVYRVEGEDSPGADAKHYRIRLSHTGSLTVSELLNQLTSTNAGTLLGSREEIIQALNIVVGHNPKAAAEIASIGANRHYALDAADFERSSLGAGLTAIRGFFFSVRAATGRLLMNIQVKHGAFYEDGPLDRLMSAYAASIGFNRPKVGSFVIEGLATPRDGAGLEHPPRISEYGAGAKDVEFWMDSQGETSASGSAQGGGGKGKKGKKAGPAPPLQGRYISVYDFFRSQYNIAVSEPKLPVVNVGSKDRPSYLPAQVCMVIPGQTCNTQLSPSQTQQMIRFAVRKPAQNAMSIVTSGAKMLAVGNNSTLDAFNISITPRLLTVPGRVLNAPNVKYAGQKSASTRFGSWNMQQVQFTTKTTLNSWTYLWISYPSARDPWRDEGDLQKTITAFAAKLREVGITCSECMKGLRVTVTPGNADSAIDTALHRFTSSPNKPPPKLVLIILPDYSGPIYNRVKYACDVKEGLMNVNVQAAKFAKDNNGQYFANVALKINAKLGGMNQSLDQPKLGIIAEGKTMVVGIDVTHPSPGSSSTAPSIVGIVASIDKWLGQFPADLAIQTARQEMVAGLKDLVKVRLEMWKRHNTAYPENILVYRDGVSEGQYNLVLDHELPEIRAACTEVYPATATKQGIPRITIVVVGKRHHTRFYPTKAEQADRSSNPQHGTVVDRGVTEARNWDFYLQAHTAIQGTARPAHYYVVYDEIFQARKVPPGPFKSAADILEDLTHNMCYLYARATKSVSICPPAYYADLVCDRARCYLSGFFDPAAASSAGSVSGGGTNTQGPDSSMVKIHPRVRDSMFYI
ncbi:PAZ domain-containing protein [Cladophialophora immunda]|nr:PAZ domain-containing protein [Cladophialophora immunda]